MAYHNVEGVPVQRALTDTEKAILKADINRRNGQGGVLHGLTDAAVAQWYNSPAGVPNPAHYPHDVRTSVPKPEVQAVLAKPLLQQQGIVSMSTDEAAIVAAQKMLDLLKLASDQVDGYADSTLGGEYVREMAAALVTAGLVEQAAVDAITLRLPDGYTLTVVAGAPALTLFTEPLEIEEADVTAALAS